jgi:hypothetical protein
MPVAKKLTKKTTNKKDSITLGWKIPVFIILGVIIISCIVIVIQHKQYYSESNFEVTNIYYDSESDFEITNINGEVTITDYLGFKKKIRIPPRIQNLPVTSIGEYAFSFYTGLTSVTIPNSVTSIGEEVFNGCTNLSVINIDANNNAYSADNGVLYNKNKTSLHTYPAGNKSYSFTIPNSVTSIGGWAFNGCIDLINITIPNSVTDIREGVFNGCTNLSVINIDANNNAYSADNGVLYNKNKTLLHTYTAGNKRYSFTIPDSVTSIGGWAFNGCIDLINITIPNSVTSIGIGAFSGCTSLADITIPNSVTSIEGFAFYGCISLAGITIPNSVTSIGDLAFSNCNSLTNITIPNSVTSIGDLAFSNCTNLANVTFASGSNISDINFGDYAFPEGSEGVGGDTLKSAYSTGKAGTYTRAAGSYTWTKQY